MCSVAISDSGQVIFNKEDQMCIRDRTNAGYDIKQQTGIDVATATDRDEDLAGYRMNDEEGT